jgi:catechol 2,3-dioxygenase-like lactoylglutathione lyase family enzyme
MAVELNHTIVKVSDKAASAEFYQDILGLAEHTTYGPFTVVALANDLTLDFAEQDDEVNPQHYAFLVSEGEFDQIKDRIVARGLTFWGDPSRRMVNEINREDGGRGLYWEDPDGHFLEIITRPYGSGS